MISKLTFILFLRFLFTGFAQSNVQFGETAQGDGTYYGLTNGAGHCSFQFSKSESLPWATGINSFVALNAPQYGDSSACGLCLQYKGTGSGSGGDPVSPSPQYGLIADECPECLTGSLDIAEAKDGRWGISWLPVQCQVGTSSFQYSFQGSNSYYIKMSVTNTRVPVQSVSLSIGGAYASMKRTIDNYFVLFSGNPVTFPADVQVTSILGDTVTDTINAASPQSPPVTGSGQFPASSTLPSVGQVSSEAAQRPLAVSPTLSPPTTSGPLSGQNASTPPPPPSAASVIASAANVIVPNQNSNCSFSINNYQQCGGQGGNCRSRGCTDSTWEGGCCSTGYACDRINAFWWQCNRKSTAGVEAASGVVAIGDYEQCGGLTPGDTTTFDVTPIDGQWANTTCSSSFVCVRWDAQFYQCSDFPYISANVANGTAPSSDTASTNGTQIEGASSGVPLGQTTCY